MIKKPQKIQLFHTCLVNEFYPEAGMSVVNILEYLGIEVDVPLGQTCCGQPAFNTGFQKETKKAARHTIELLSNTEGPIVIPSGSCTDMITHQYPLLFQGDTAFLPEVKAVIKRCYEFTQFLVDVLGVTSLGARLNAKVAYHPSCHLVRGVGIIKQPVSLLENIKDLEITVFEEQDECCGFGGTFSAKHPEISGSIMHKKIKDIELSEADMVVSCDMGCLMHLEGGLHRKGSSIKVKHIAQVLEAGLK